jgi:deoxycytidine triphosphate deaminase
MIWNDLTIRGWATSGGVFPYDATLVNPASIDLRWSGRIRRAAERWHAYNVPSDFAENPLAWDTNKLWGKEYTLAAAWILPGELVLVDTLERVHIPEDAGATLMLKSSMGRVGLEHLHAGWFDPGFRGTATLELKNLAPWPVALVQYMPLVQLVLQQMMQPPQVSYADVGRYQNQSGPTAARDKGKADE